MEYIFLLFISIFPVALIAFILYAMDKEKESFLSMLKFYGLGLATAVLAVVVELIVGMFLPAGDTIIGAFCQAFIVAASVEELCKFFFLFIGIKLEKSYNNFYDSIIFATAVSLGFAGIENVLYVVLNESFAAGLGTGIMRALLAVPGHAIFAIYMGFFLDKAMEAKSKNKSAAMLIILAIFLPILLHGIYDFFCFTFSMIDTPIYYLLFCVYVLFMYVSGIVLVVLGVKKSHLSFGGKEQQTFGGYTQAKACANCQNVYYGNFCPRCGSNQVIAPQPVQPQALPIRYCHKCGTPNQGVFCTKCGISL